MNIFRWGDKKIMPNTAATTSTSSEEKEITTQEEGKENVIISSTTPPLLNNNNNNNNITLNNNNSSNNNSSNNNKISNISNNTTIPITSTTNTSTINTTSNNNNNNINQPQSNHSSPLSKSNSNNNFKSSLSSFLTNYTIKSTSDGSGDGVSNSSSAWLLGHFKNSISLITNNIPTIPSSLPYPTIPTIGSISSFTNNIPVLSYLSNSIPFPINYSSKTTTPNTKDNVTANTQPSPLKKQPSNNNLTSSSSSPTTTSTNNSNSNVNSNNKMSAFNSTQTTSSFYHLGNEDQYQEIINRLEQNNYKHILSTMDTFIDSVNSDPSLTVEDISSSVKSIISTTLPMLLNACAGVPFFSSSQSVIESKTPCISSLVGKNPQEVEIIVYEFLEQYITSRLYRRIFSSPDGIQKDTKLCEHISNFQHITPSNLDINDNLISNQFLEQIQEELLHMTAYKAPREKLNCIMKSFKTLFQLLSKSQISSNSIGADLLLPIVIYCLIKSNLPFLYSNLQYISLFRDPSLIEAETNYYLITLITATSFIEDMTFDSLTNAVDPSKEPISDSNSLSTSTSSIVNPNDDLNSINSSTDNLNTFLKDKDNQNLVIEQQQKQQQSKQQQEQQHESLKKSNIKNNDLVKDVNNNNNNNIDLFQEKKKNWKYYHSKPEDLSIKDVKQLLLDYNRLVDSFYDIKQK